MNIGEEICGEWLRHLKGCDFVQYNVRTTDSRVRSTWWGSPW